jgi:hypothetical protein
MDFRGLTTKELAGYGQALQKYLSDPEFQNIIDDFAKSKGIGSGHLPEVQGVDQQLRMTGIDNAGSGDKLYPSSNNNEAVRKFISDKEVTKGIYNPATTLTDAQKKYLMELKNAPGTGKSRTMIEMLDKMTPEARANVLSNQNAFDNIEKFILKSPATKELTQVSRGIDTLGKAIGPAVAVAEGGLAAQGVYEKMKAGESFKEATSNPELVKNAARGVLGYMGGNAGAAAGVAGSSMLPGGLPVKLATEIGSAVGGAYLGTKLADLLTGNPVLDKIIRDRYEKARNERMAQTKPTAASSVALRPGE